MYREIFMMLKFRKKLSKLQMVYEIKLFLSIYLDLNFIVKKSIAFNKFASYITRT